MSYTYSDFLAYLNISHTTFIIICIIGFLILSFFMLLKNLGLLQTVKFKKDLFPKSKVLYINHHGHYQKISLIMGKLAEKASSKFPEGDVFVIYYDDSIEKDLNTSRAVIGIILKPNDEVDQFIKENADFKWKQKIIEQTKCISTKYPFFNQMSVIMVGKRVYSKLQEEAQKLKKQSDIDIGPGIMEIYHLNKGDDYIKVLVPISNNQDFNLWQHKH